jgi:mRNA interferase MazF
MKRGEVWTAAGGSDYGGKPRPVAVVQADRFDSNDSVTVCPLTSDGTDLPLFRVTVDPSPENGLRVSSRLMADKLSTIPRAKIGRRLGTLAPRDIERLDRAILVFLGLAG